MMEGVDFVTNVMISHTRGEVLLFSFYDWKTANQRQGGLRIWSTRHSAGQAQKQISAAQPDSALRKSQTMPKTAVEAKPSSRF